MRSRALLVALIGVGLVWLFVIGPSLYNASLILRHAEGYRDAELLVEEVSCIYKSIGDRTRRGRMLSDCFVEGTIDGQEGFLSTETSPEELPLDLEALERRFPPGSTVRVLFNPEAPVSGIGHDSIQVLWWVPDLAAERTRLVVQGWIFGAVALSLVLALYLALRIGISRRSSVDPDELWIDLERPWSGLGLIVASCGIALVAMQLLVLLQHFALAITGLYFGGLLSLGGAALLIRGWVQIRRSEMSRGWHFCGLPFATVSRHLLHEEVELRVDREAGSLVVALMQPDERLEIFRTKDLEKARSVANKASQVLRCETTDLTRFDSGAEQGPVLEGASAALRVASFIARVRKVVVSLILLLALAGAAVLVWSPTRRNALYRSVLDPASALHGFRVTAAEKLGNDASDETVLQLVRALATAQPEADSDLHRAALDSLLRIAGPGFEALAEDAPGRLFVWAGQRLGRELDDNGGVLGWFDVDQAFRDEIEAMASADPEAGWQSWSLFGAGDLTSSRQFLWAVGAALADERPISFVITCGDGSFRSHAESVRDTILEPCAHTVGEALAAKLCMFADLETEGDLENFHDWWPALAERRHLPPSRCPSR